MPNKFWFNSYSNISLNREIKEYHILIAHRFFDLFLANKLYYVKIVRKCKKKLHLPFIATDVYY